MWNRIGPVPVEDLTGPDKDDQFRFAGIGHIMCPTGIDSTTLESSEDIFKFIQPVSMQLPESETSLSLDHQELLGLRMMIMLPLETPGPAVKNDTCPESRVLTNSTNRPLSSLWESDLIGELHIGIISLLHSFTDTIW